MTRTRSLLLARARHCALRDFCVRFSPDTPEPSGSPPAARIARETIGPGRVPGWKRPTGIRHFGIHRGAGFANHLRPKTGQAPPGLPREPHARLRTVPVINDSDQLSVQESQRRQRPPGPRQIGAANRSDGIGRRRLPRGPQELGVGPHLLLAPGLVSHGGKAVTEHFRNPGGAPQRRHDRPERIVAVRAQGYDLTHCRRLACRRPRGKRQLRLMCRRHPIRATAHGGTASPRARSTPRLSLGRDGGGRLRSKPITSS